MSSCPWGSETFVSFSCRSTKFPSYPIWRPLLWASAENEKTCTSLHSCTSLSCRSDKDEVYHWTLNWRASNGHPRSSSLSHCSCSGFDSKSPSHGLSTCPDFCLSPFSSSKHLSCSDHGDKSNCLRGDNFPSSSNCSNGLWSPTELEPNIGLTSGLVLSLVCSESFDDLRGVV